MSVLIKGMKMPENCDYCGFISSTGCCRATEEYHDEEQTVAGLYGEDKRPDWCPLIEVPPHGDLIDRDAINYEDEIWKKKCISPLSVYNAWVVAGEMPTIIEAEDNK